MTVDLTDAELRLILRALQELGLKKRDHGLSNDDVERLVQRLLGLLGPEQRP